MPPEAGPRRPRTHARNSQPPWTQCSLKSASIALFSALAATATAQSSGQCISLKGSTECSAFQSASISTNQTLVNFYPFLQFVSDRQSFDYQLSTYVQTAYVKDKYQLTLGCQNTSLTNTSDMYARYTTTVICNALVQMSATPCGLSSQESLAVCAETCAEYAQSEAYITADPDLCANPNSDLSKLIRADFTTCSLPDEALSGSCILGVDNEPDNCGFGNSTIGLCSYCGAGGINSTDTCCYSANAEQRCQGVTLPAITPTLTFSPPTASSSATDPAIVGTDTSGGLSGGAIAGVVIGSLAGVALLAALLFFCLRMRRRRGGSQQGSIFNQPSPARKGPPMAQGSPSAPRGYEVLPGGRIARMSALEGHTGESPSQDNGSPSAGVGGYASGPKVSDHLSSSEFGESPEPEVPYAALRAPPAASRRQGSLSSNSILGSDVPQSPQSPGSPGGFSSPQGMASQQSEQLPYFRDYYSPDDIHPGDKVAVLWAYQPRAADEFALERGDMLKVVGIWDDGWATGLMVDQRADEWEARRRAQRDSGVSNTSGARDSSPEGYGELKAFPLVCVCLPEHWRKTIEGDGSTDTGGNGQSPAS